jgi:hypothetical protein
MDELAYFHQIDVPTLIHVALFITLWAAALSLSIIGSARGASDPARRGTGRPTITRRTAEIFGKVGRLFAAQGAVGVAACAHMGVGSAP